MDRDTFIITVYCLVEEHYQHLTATRPIRHGGFAPQLSDVEVITMVICGEFFKLPHDTDLFAYFRAHYAHFFPVLTNRTLFVRQAANLWQLQAAIQRRLVRLSCHATDPVQVIDTIPLPVCTYSRGGRRDHCFPGQADYGSGAAKQLHYYGFKLGLCITRCGLITHYPLLAARPHDSHSIWMAFSPCECHDKVAHQVKEVSHGVCIRRHYGRSLLLQRHLSLLGRAGTCEGGL
jgi:hypothetical protein